MKILIVGGVAGGATVAARLRRVDEKAEIILFERGEYVSYANCGLPYYIGGTIASRDSLFVQTVEGFVGRFKVDIRVLSSVEQIDRENKTVQIKNLVTGDVYTESYDKLILSPGAEPVRPQSIKGITSERVFTLRNVPDTDRIKQYVIESKPKTAVVVGGGFIGLEMAENLHELGLKVSVVEMADQVMAPLDFSMASIVHQHLLDKGIKLHLNEGVSGFDDQLTTIKVNLQSGKEVVADMVVWSIGVRPDVKLAKDAGLELGKLGGIAVNSYMQTSDESIYALGDAVEVFNPICEKQVLIPLAGPANKQGRIVANNVVFGNSTTYDGTIGTAVAKIFDLTVASTGLSAKVLKKEGIAYKSSYTHSSSHAGYYPNALPLSIKIIFAPDTGKLLGAQVVGYDGVDKRIDVIASFLKNKGTIYDLCEFEHAYAPPYSSAKDPVNIAGFVAENILKNRTNTIHWRELDQTVKSGALLVDVRTEDEYSLGSIDGAINIPLDELRTRLNEVSKDKDVVVFCAVGLRGYVAERLLAHNGFNRVKNLQGGYKTYSMATCSFDGGVACSSLIALGDEEEKKFQESSAVGSTVTVDACGLQCPGPILQLKRSYDALNAGDVLVVKATDQAFGKDVASWCRVTGASLLGVESSKGIITASLQKKAKEVADIPATASAADGKTLVVFSDDLDKALASFVIANGAAAMGKKVTMFFTFWGLNIIKKPKKPSVEKDFMGKMFGIMLPSSSLKLKLSKLNMWGMGRRMMRGIMKRKNIDSLETLMQQAIDNNIELIACTMSMDVMGVKKEELLDNVSYAGVATYLERAEDANVNLFV